MNRNRGTGAAIPLLVSLAVAGGLAAVAARAQTPAAGGAADTTQAAAATPDASTAPAAAARPKRLSWLSDELPLRVGDVVTILIDERTTASEWSSEEASHRRALKASFSAETDGTSAMGSTGVSSGWNASSSSGGQAGRRGALQTEVTARVTSIDAAGLATLEARKAVIVDGRRQEVVLKGVVRSQDVAPGNVVTSARLADLEVSYKGKKMAPRMGMIGKLVSAIWPF